MGLMSGGRMQVGEVFASGRGVWEVGEVSGKWCERCVRKRAAFIVRRGGGGGWEEGLARH